MILKIILLFGLMLNNAHSLEINEDDFNRVTNELRHISQQLQDYKVKFGNLKAKPEFILQTG